MQKQTSKEELMEVYRDTLHKMAVSTELLELDGYFGAALEVIRHLSALKLINLKEQKEMETTVNVFHWKTSHSILEAEE